ncbi:MULTISPECIES: heavy metal sensor histidine kinase [unclassified Oceanobacter]|uniref:heavy metal sensor histidine kinase n=1 Tax=unclassified Oceanobacter TaxID=2620260 RepID=UPI002737534C|nr:MULTISPECIES: heavy metal sensor histidine kinase [unclassified Oceanobacter]MDP2609685.1 heavy metal sensor histidine kinase [Oceanobacter sp. 1_MG-2023]MDP2613403.1 heavy metal sensor histidine kinase [Oceanobacter sp. 2_MG-2023]
MIKRPLSLQWRVTLLTAVVISAGLILLVSMVQNSIRSHFAEQDSQELAQAAAAIQQVFYTSPDRAEVQAGQPLPAHVQHLLEQISHSYHGISLQLLVERPSQPLTTRYHSGNASVSDTLLQQPSVTHINAKTLTNWQQEARPYRGVLVHLTLPATSDDATWLLMLATDMRFHLRFLDDFRNTLWAIVLGIGLLTLLAVWFSIHQGHAPLRQISQRIARIDSEQLNNRLDPNQAPSELVPLIQAFNDMLSRLETGFERLSNFSADIAHELRTPLTNLITQTQVMLGQPRDLNAYRELLYSSLEEEERLARMVADMLWLAKADNGLQGIHPEPINLQEDLHELMDFFEAWADEQQVRLTFNHSESPQLTGDRNMIRRAISNLLSNAIRHTEPGHSVAVELRHIQRQNQAYARLEIHNPGPDIPAKHLPHLFDRFYRADTARQKHPDSNPDSTGLGLAITHSIINLHKGTIGVHSSHGNTCFYLEIPANR